MTLYSKGHRASQSLLARYLEEEATKIPTLIRNQMVEFQTFFLFLEFMVGIDVKLSGSQGKFDDMFWEGHT